MSQMTTRLANLSSHFLSRHSQIPRLRPGIYRAFSTDAKASEADEPQQNRFNTGITPRPHPAKRDKGGEDAAALSPNFIALADGVGGWIESGIDPAKYSRSLCRNISNLIVLDELANKYMCNPRQLCVEAAQLTKETGSSTLVIASLDREAPILYTSNIGDSGYILLRKTQNQLVSIYRSQE